jgi:hypothetical protein
VSRIRASTVPVSSVDTAQRAAMWQIFARYYAEADRSRFDADLASKDHVFLLHAGTQLCGFSTVCVDHVEVGGRRMVSVFSGDTVIDRDYHGQTALQWAFFKYIVRVKLRYPHRTAVWFLISKGYKTYLLLARNFVVFFPRRDRPTAAWASEMICALAQRRFGTSLDPDRLVLRFDGDHEYLRDDVAPTTGLDDPDIQFFVERNPGHASGDELCCVGVVDARLMLAYPLKLLRRRA